MPDGGQIRSQEIPGEIRGRLPNLPIFASVAGKIGKNR
jgi:hypothetical protein